MMESLGSWDDIREAPSNDGASSLDEETVPHGGDVPPVEYQQTSMEARSLSEGEQKERGQPRKI